MFFTPLGFAITLLKTHQVLRAVGLFTRNFVQAPIFLPDGLELNTSLMHFGPEIHGCSR